MQHIYNLSKMQKLHSFLLIPNNSWHQPSHVISQNKGQLVLNDPLWLETKSPDSNHRGMFIPCATRGLKSDGGWSQDPKKPNQCEWPSSVKRENKVITEIDRYRSRKHSADTTPTTCLRNCVLLSTHASVEAPADTEHVHESCITEASIGIRELLVSL